MATTEQLAADPVTLHQLFSADNSLRCPLFQRPYVWKPDNIKRLWDDIDSVLEGQCDVRFLGALVFDNESASTSSSPGLYWIIDGQQRLTSLYLSLCALSLVAKEAGSSELSDALSDEYLLSRKTTSRLQPKLSPTLQDTRQFNQVVLSTLGEKAKVFRAQESGASTGTLIDAYELIRKEVRRRCLDAENKVSVELVSRLREVLLEKLEFVEIRLGQKHDANEVFDRLNKEGARLGIVDLIRNEVLKRLKDDASSAEEVYTTQWRPFEESFNSQETMEGYFFPHALTRDSGVTKSRTFISLSKRWAATYGAAATPIEQISAVMDDLREHVDVYHHLREGKSVSLPRSVYTDRLDALHRMRCPSVVYPYIFSLHSAVRSGAESEQDAAKALLLVETFLFRRAMSGIEPTGLHAVFKGLWPQVGTNIGKLRAQLENKTVKFPNDEEFKIAIDSAPLYTRKIRNFAMLELERSFTKGDVLKTFPEMTADHVLPQSPTADWASKFTKAQINRWIDTWANLVPLSAQANSGKGNRSWRETRDRLGNETVFATTKHLLDEFSDWNPESLEVRSQRIAIWALSRWADVSTPVFQLEGAKSKEKS
ncbi:DUF262 domain-containing protein [Noviluteimonas gilva]|uniref:DUF262 domain-containing protein n=1 Tax=Noviluteimonas gilva TaxID=2682097 RepID=A0A7C9LG40_9GAMM|nr:DUF262 domain-containing protein [Lysobacter gilvus]MUV12940.1 DUF262 domain-containing protein [Lysobacter gilvus]